MSNDPPKILMEAISERALWSNSLSGNDVGAKLFNFEFTL